MLNSILYFEQFCIKNLEKLEDEFLKNPNNFAEYVFGITGLLCKFGTEMLRDSLETMDRMLCESAFRQKSWTIEAHHTKTLITSLGDVSFRKTLFLNRQTKQHSYLLDQIMGLEPKQRLTEDAAAGCWKKPYRLLTDAEHNRPAWVHRSAARPSKTGFMH
ncbi:MAG: hypothetical protein HFH49_17030 [Lachnospiraceae bacterium]|nr:hypothetical protein [Lachnospiraceae bacterium]